MNKRHGHCIRGKRSPTYGAWISMRTRCRNAAGRDYKDYGGRGITVCPRWNVFANFLADMGERPDGKTLDRYPDNNGNYEPGNCRWATPYEQTQNTRRTRLISFNGECMGLRAWARRMDITDMALHGRLQRGWSIEKALTHPKDFKKDWTRSRTNEKGELVKS